MVWVDKIDVPEKKYRKEFRLCYDKAKAYNKDSHEFLKKHSGNTGKSEFIIEERSELLEYSVKNGVGEVFLYCGPRRWVGEKPRIKFEEGVWEFDVSQQIRRQYFHMIIA